MTQRSVDIFGLPGDGIGPEVYPYANGVLEAANKLLGFDKYRVVTGPFNAQYFHNHGEAWPEGTIEELAQDYDAALLMALGDRALLGDKEMAHAKVIILDGFRGHKKWQTNLNIRPTMLLHPDLRPEIEPAPYNFELFSLSEADEQIEEKERKNGDIEEVYPEETYSAKALKSHLTSAARRAKALGENKLIIVDKSNVFKFGHGLWKTISTVVARDEGIEIEQQYMDSFLERLIKNPKSVPKVVVTDRLFGSVLLRAFEALKRGKRGEIPEDFNVTLGRENTQGMYFGRGRKEEVGDDTIGHQIGRHSSGMIYENIVETAELARKNKRRKVIVLHVDDVHPKSYELWKRTAVNVAGRRIQLEFMHAGDFIATLIENPEKINGEVFACDNILGDICGDAAAGLIGGLSIPPTDQVNTTEETRKHFFEPLHGAANAANSIVGLGIADPTGAIMTAAEILGAYECKALKEGIHKAIRRVIALGIRPINMPDGRATTRVYGERILTEIAKIK